MNKQCWGFGNVGVSGMARTRHDKKRSQEAMRILTLVISLLYTCPGGQCYLSTLPRSITLRWHADLKNGFKDNDYSSVISQNLTSPDNERSSRNEIINGSRFRSVRDMKEDVSSENLQGAWDTIVDSLSLALELISLPATALEVTKLSDDIDKNSVKSREWLLRLGRSSLLSMMLERDRYEYITTVSFLGTRIPRNELPNVQDIPMPDISAPTFVDQGFVADCTLLNKTFTENPLDKILLRVFRGLVQKEVGFKSDTRGIKGLLEEGRYFMMSPEGTEENQHSFVKRTLGALMTPLLPPFYRIFMAGIIPSAERGDPDWLVEITEKLIGVLPDGLRKEVYPGRQFGPWFYAPFLTSLVTPPLIAFLLGPCKTNRRKDGRLGGMVAEKCKFLQESGCKGLCLHQCKLPAQQFFDETLGLSLTVEPNFLTQECQWSWGEKAVDHTKDPAFPHGCLQGCPSRSLVSERGASSCY